MEDLPVDVLFYNYLFHGPTTLYHLLRIHLALKGLYIKWNQVQTAYLMELHTVSIVMKNIKFVLIAAQQRLGHCLTHQL